MSEIDGALISIIVPVYNVEEFLRRCVDSIKNQTYTNLEIILVDDGSTDNSGKICNEYSYIDNRVVVIHKENGGLSEARNYGIEIAKGEYINFIDSDDYVSNNYIALLYKLLIENNADIAIGNTKKVYGEKECENVRFSNSYTQMYSRSSAIKNMFYQKNITNSACGKLYHASLFRNIRYPLDKIYEDLGTTYKLMFLAERIVYNSTDLYFYYQRPQSIMYRKYDIKNMDRISLSEELLEWTNKNCPDLVMAAVTRNFISNIQVLRELPIRDSTYKYELEVIKKNIKGYRRVVVLDHNAKCITRLIAFVSFFGINFLSKFGNLYKKIYS